MLDPALAALLPTLTLLGILDTDNYTPILVLLFVLARRGGGPDAFWFTVGVVATQFAGGVLFALLYERLQALDLPWLRPVAVWGQITLGLGLVGAGLFWRKRSLHGSSMPLHGNGAEDLAQADTHNPVFWLVLGIAIEITKLLTGFVYFDAIRRIRDSGTVLAEQVGLLVYFNIVAFLPFILIWGLYLLLGRTNPEHLRKGRVWLQTHERALIRFAFIAVGAFLIVNGLLLA